MIIDSHQHFWSPDGKDEPWDYGWLLEPEHGPINRSFTPADLAPLLTDNGVDGSIFVQAQHHLDETRWAIRMAEENEFLLAVVGFVDLQSPEIETQLDEVCQSPWFKGVRHVVQDEPDDNFLLQPAVLNGLKALARRDLRFDLLVQPRHLKMLPELAQTVPDLQMVIDHCAKPAIKSGDTDQWHREFGELGKFDNLCCKVSGLVTEADWQHWTLEQLKPIFATALETFGSDRLLYGSDWPVCTLAASYHQVFDSCQNLIADLSTGEQAAILGGNAKLFYQL